MATGDVIQGPAQVETTTTSDGNNHEIDSWPLPDNTSLYLLVEVMAQRYNGAAPAEMYLYVNYFLFNCDGTSTATLRASDTAKELDPQATGWRVTVDENNNDARVQVQGTAGENVRWVSRLTGLQVEQPVS